jgi:transposase
MSNRNSKTGKSANFAIRQRRVFSDAFKREKVDDLLNKRISIAELSKLWEVSDTAIRHWIRQYSPLHKKGITMVIQQDSESVKTQELLKRVAELERTIGQKQMVIDYQDKLLEVASKELEIDIKKNFSPIL